MAAERLSMRQLREILRQKLVMKRTHREIAASVGVSAGSVGGAVSRATRGALAWSAVEAMSDEALEVRLYGPRAGQSCDRPRPDCAYIHAERSKPGVTLELLHLEYIEKHPDGLRYTQFCDDYRNWLNRRRLSMRQVHHAGEKLFVDYSGKRPHVVDGQTGEIVEVELFVAVLEHQSVLITGMTGTGKTYVACALAQQACRKGFRAVYRRASRLFNEVRLARADGTYPRLLARLARVDVLAIDDFAIAPVTDEQRRDLLEILDDRYETRSTIVTSQLDPKDWRDYLADPTLADAICDRLLHNAHRLVLKGPSRRKEKPGS